MGIRLSTLGQFSVQRDGMEETSILTWRRRLGLLTYLGVEGKATRDQLTTLFWPEKDPEKARHSLSQAIYEIRRACGSSCLKSHGDWVRSTPSLEVDAARFQALVEEGRYEEALEHYGGEFLPGTHLVATAEFEQWVGRTQARLRRLHRVSRDAVIRSHMEKGNQEAALPIARRWVEMEPLEDEAQHRFIHLLALVGRRSEALSQYEVFERALAQDDLEPLDETKQLVEDIRSGKETGGLAALTHVSREESTEVGNGEAEGPHADERVPSHGLIEALRERWVFRVAITYAATLFVWVQVGDALISVASIPQLTVLRVTALGLAALPALVALTWALEPWLRERSPRGSPSGASGPRIPFHLGAAPRAMGALLVVLVSCGIGFLTWPEESAPEAAAVPIEPPTARHGFAILPLLAEDSADAVLVNVSAHLTRSLIAHFRSFDVLNVPSEARVARYSLTVSSPDSILQELGVELLIHGRLGRRGDSLLLSLDFESPGFSGDHLETRVPFGAGWSEIQLVEQVSVQITDQLRRKLRGEFRTRDLRLGTRSPEAWTLAQQGEDERARAVGLINRADFSGTERALAVADSLYVLAGEEDPAWPEPLFMRGYLTTYRVLLGNVARNVDPGSSLAISREESFNMLLQGVHLIDAGLALDPAHKDGLFKKAEVLRLLSSNLRDPDSIAAMELQIEQTLQNAIRGDPPRPDAMLRLAQLYYSKSQYREAGELYEKAYARDIFLQRLPNDILNMGRIRLEAGEEERGFQECAEGSEDATGWERYMRHECQMLLLAFGTEFEPDIGLAETLVQDSTTLGIGMGGPQAGPNPNLLTLYAAVLARAGLSDSARAIGELASRDHLPSPSTYEIALMALLGEFPRAVEALQGSGSHPLHSRLFDPLRGYPPFDSLRAPEG